MSDSTWWRGAVIYQIYPRSFLDTNADGVGDLPGVIERLDYIASLGVDAIWISPFFKSPMADFGYDIADYRAVDPLFGTMDDFERLLDKAHGLGLKVMIDQVLSHTSVAHDWFRESRQNATNPKADWYVWADAKADGTPPNNWMSIFGGVAWRWEPRRRQYFLHNFLSAQPDLNFHNPHVRQAALDNVQFWLDKGVDAFRLDAINFCFHDRELRDNPPKPVDQRVGRGFSPDNPYAYQYHYFNNTQPENLAFLEELRALIDRYPGTATLGEISSEDSLATMADYTRDKRLHMSYSFELLGDDFSAAYIRTTVAALDAKMIDGWPCWAISNHDVKRVLTRWGGDAPTPALAKMLTVLVASLRGTVCIYQGEELGLGEAELRFEDLQDPYGIRFWPEFKGRDGCRTPMVWDGSAKNGGFSQAKPWLPVPAKHLAQAVNVQQGDQASLLEHYRRFLTFRRAHPALAKGDITFIESEGDTVAFTRRAGNEQVVCVFNLGAKPAKVDLGGRSLQPLPGHGFSGQASTGSIELGGYAAWFGRID